MSAWRRGRLLVLTALVGIFFGNAIASEGRDPQSERCLECHEPARHGLPMHPLGVRPARTRGLPLADGRIGCLTCHRRHGFSVEASRSTDFHLRQQPPVLCGSCHRDDQGRWDRPHALYADTIHGGSRLAGGGGRAEREIDRLTLRCLSCHDGTSAPAVSNAARDGVLSRGASHPIGVSLSGRVGEGDDDGPARWVAGQVGCVSCHRLYGRPRPHLAAPSSMDRLCMGCHHY